MFRPRGRGAVSGASLSLYAPFGGPYFFAGRGGAGTLDARSASFNQDISNWNVGRVRRYTDIFSGATMMNRNPHYKPLKFR